MVIYHLYTEEMKVTIDTYDAKTHETQTPLHVLLNNSAARPSLKNLYDTFLTKLPKM